MSDQRDRRLDRNDGSDGAEHAAEQGEPRGERGRRIELPGGERAAAERTDLEPDAAHHGRAHRGFRRHLGVAQQPGHAGERERADHHPACRQRDEKSDRRRLAQRLLEGGEDGDFRDRDDQAAAANDHAAAEQAGERVGFRQRELSGLGGEPFHRLLGGLADVVHRLRALLQEALAGLKQRLRAALEIAERRQVDVRQLEPLDRRTVGAAGRDRWKPPHPPRWRPRAPRCGPPRARADRSAG